MYCHMLSYTILLLFSPVAIHTVSHHSLPLPLIVVLLCSPIALMEDMPVREREGYKIIALCLPTPRDQTTDRANKLFDSHVNLPPHNKYVFKRILIIKCLVLILLLFHMFSSCLVLIMKQNPGCGAYPGCGTRRRYFRRRLPRRPHLRPGS